MLRGDGYVLALNFGFHLADLATPSVLGFLYQLGHWGSLLTRLCVAAPTL